MASIEGVIHADLLASIDLVRMTTSLAEEAEAFDAVSGPRVAGGRARR